MKTNYPILFIAGAIILLTSCAYDGISGSSGEPTPVDINGLWIQAQETTLTEKDAPSCGCKNLGSPNGGPRRCFNYFEGGKVVSGYLKPSSSYNNGCASEYSLSDADKASLFNLIDNNKNLPAGTVRGTHSAADLAVGNFKNEGRNKIVMIQKDGSSESSEEGVYFNILYPGGIAVKDNLAIVCTAYAPGDNENELFIAADESGGVDNQDQSNSGCNAERHTTLIKYTKVTRPQPE